MKRIATFVSLVISIHSFAQQDSAVQQRDSLLPVEVKTVRASATAPFAKTNINKMQIGKQNMGQDLPFILNQTPSVVVNSDAGTGIGYTGIHIRGTDATRINVTLNGVPFNDAESAGTFFVDLPDFVSSVNDIQIQRGVGTSSNGSGSFGGSIILNTNEVNRTPYLESNNSYGSFSSFKNTIKLGTGLINGHFTADLRLSRITSNGYVDRAFSNLRSFYFSTAYISDNSTLRLNIFSGTEKTYQAWYGVTDADLLTNRTINYAGTEKPGAPYDNETDNYQQNHYQLFFNQKISNTLNFNIGLFYVKGKGYYEEYRAAQNYADYGMPEPVYGGTTVTTTDLVRDLWLNNDFYGDIFSLQQKTAKTELTLGGAFTHYIGMHYGDVIWAQNGMPDTKWRWYDNTAYKNDFNVYAKWQQDISNNWQGFVDLQLRPVKHDINGFDENPSLMVHRNYLFFNPKAGITYHKNGWQAFASFSVANKEPNRNDFEASPNDQPRSERLYDTEVGVEKKDKAYSWSAGFYYMKYKNQLVLTGKINNVGAYTRQNIDKSYRVGIEAQGSVSINKWLQASANITLSRNKILNFIEYIDDYDTGGQLKNTYSETDISFSPNVIGSAIITIRPLQQLSFDLFSKYVDRQYLDNTSNLQRSLKPYFTQDVRAAYSFSKRTLKNVELTFRIYNLFNHLYESNGYTYSYFYNNALTTENYYFPMAGINWMAGLNIKL